MSVVISLFNDRIIFDKLLNILLINFPNNWVLEIQYSILNLLVNM